MSGQPWIIIVVLLLAKCWDASWVEGAERQAEVARLAARIDEHLATAWKSKDVVPAPLTDDSEFLRRATLDLKGRIPTVAEVRAFLKDDAVDKRQRLIESHLTDPAYAQHLANTWRTLLVSRANPQDVQHFSPRLEAWLQRQFRDRVPYDLWVRNLLTVDLDASIPTSSESSQAVETYAIAFFQANELQPENLAAATARMFLGVNLDCAQCHNHPFAEWKQEQFWQLTAFYAGVQRLRPDNKFMAAPELFDRREITIPETKTIVPAKYLDGRQPAWSTASRPRAVLAAWVTSRDNPYFARAAVNRLWSHCFGRGIIEPLEELGGRQAPSHPRLLDELTREFVQHDFDLCYVLQSIMASQAYQRTSRLTHPSQKEPEHFSRMKVRGLTPEQVVDSFQVATGWRAGEDDRGRNELLRKFADLNRPTETQTSIVQALTLLNGKLTAEATDLTKSATLSAVLEAPFLDDRAKVETLFLATLSRVPTAAEWDRVLPTNQPASPELLADLFWALLNSGEFLLNH